MKNVEKSMKIRRIFVKSSKKILSSSPGLLIYGVSWLVGSLVRVKLGATVGVGLEMTRGWWYNCLFVGHKISISSA